MKITFLGATSTVTGSRFIVETEKSRIMVDAGLYQGLKELRELNWQPFPLPPASIDAVILTHAHIDHCGYLPRLVHQGFKGPVYATGGTTKLVPILLRDAAKLQEEEAIFANKFGYSKHSPAEPLYTLAHAEAAITLLRGYNYNEKIAITDDIALTFHRAGHILGSAHIELTSNGKSLIFSGDVGREEAAVMPAPARISAPDLLICESTYGDRPHPTSDPKEQFAQIINEAFFRGGALIIPAFAVGRTQELLYIIRELEEAGKIPTLPVYLDSPMAQEVTQIYLASPEEVDEAMLQTFRRLSDPLATARLTYVGSNEESKKLNELKEPFIVISASGMATGGRVLHHLKNRLSDPKTTVLFVGYQAEGTRGRDIIDGASRVKMLGTEVMVAAHIEKIAGFSAHADQNELLRWIGAMGPKGPKQIALVHGEAKAEEALKAALETSGYGPVSIPTYNSTIEL